MTKILTIGIKELSRNKFEMVTNGDMFGLNKPNGGFWGSTFIENKRNDEDEYYPSSWAYFCSTADIRKDRLNYGILYRLKESANIYEINSIEDYEELIDKYSILYKTHSYKNYIDWEKISKDYDGIHLTEPMFWKLRMGIPGHRDFADFYSWDCESYCLFNLDCINLDSIESYENLNG